MRNLQDSLNLLEGFDYLPDLVLGFNLMFSCFTFIRQGQHLIIFPCILRVAELLIDILFRYRGDKSTIPADYAIFCLNDTWSRKWCFRSCNSWFVLILN